MAYLRTKALFFIYLAFYVSAEPVVRHLSQKVELHEPSKPIAAPLHHTINLREFGASSLCDTNLQENLAVVGDDTVRLRTADDRTFCSGDDAYDYAIRILSNRTATNSTLDGRQVEAPTIVLVQVAYVAGTGFVGTVSLFAVGGVTVLAAAIVGVWFLAKALFGHKDEATKRSAHPEVDDPDTCCPPPPPPPVQKVHVSYSDAGTYDQSAVNENKNRDMNAAQSCVQKIENWNHAASGGCCKVSMKGSGGYEYISAIGVATIGPNDSGFVCYQEKH